MCDPKILCICNLLQHSRSTCPHISLESILIQFRMISAGLIPKRRQESPVLGSHVFSTVFLKFVGKTLRNLSSHA